MFFFKKRNMEKPLLIITGVSGRIGSASAKLFSKDFHVVGLDIVPPKASLGIDFIPADISSLAATREALAQVKSKFGGKIASFVHLAAYYNFTGGEWEKYQKITINGTKNLLEALEDFELTQFVFSSTMLVYAPCKRGEKIREESVVDPKWEYPLSKTKTEEIIRKRQGNSKSVILRIAGVYDDDCNSIPISQHIIRIYEKRIESHLFPGNPDQGATFLHMDDLLQALKLVVEKREILPKEELFALGEPDLMTFQDLQDEIGRLLHGKPWWTLRIPKWFAKLGAFFQEKIPFIPKSFIKPWMIDLADDHYDLDISKAQNILGWQPAKKLKNCLPKMISSLQEDPKNWIKKHQLGS